MLENIFPGIASYKSLTNRPEDMDFGILTLWNSADFITFPVNINFVSLTTSEIKPKPDLLRVFSKFFRLHDDIGHRNTTNTP